MQVAQFKLPPANSLQAFAYFLFEAKFNVLRRIAANNAVWGNIFCNH